MARVLAYDDAKINQEHRQGGAVVKTPFFGPSEDPRVPHASLIHRDPGRASSHSAHFHARDQFQVFVSGKGKIGRHDLAPYRVHFARAYTPYGPLIADPSEGVSFFVMRAHRDKGAQNLPGAREQLMQIPNRQPWQLTCPVNFPTQRLSTMAVSSLIQEIRGIKDENGLVAYALSMKPNARVKTPDPSQGDGQYVVAVKGSLVHDDKEHKAWALAFVEPQEKPFLIQAGAEGLEAIILNFPQVKPYPARAKVRIPERALKKWQCLLCTFAYDEALGMPEEGIPAGTRWENVPETWTCPDCAARKSDFQMVEV